MRQVKVQDTQSAYITESEDKFGKWIAFEINGAHQVMRWVEPGDFLMGSPENEAQRNDNELQHPVTLTHGYWLAETVCSQRLWQAVTGWNPSMFEGHDHPVERVSFCDTVSFCKDLNDLLPSSLTVRLPTEAEWEYACRAGSTSAFSWGDALDSDRANFDGQAPYPGSSSPGKYRTQTLAAKSFNPNAWGFYQMHGNVWEWCSDGFSNYAEMPETDPRGNDNSRRRVLRGGSWWNMGHCLRSAHRYPFVPESRYQDTGFRLACG